ncbi:MAG: VWA domain-containing protein, partial [Acidobacteriota bacterium]
MHQLLAAANRLLPTAPLTAPRRRPAWTALTLALAAALAPALYAQTDAPSGAPAEESFGESIDVELVNVDVWVTDRGGEPIRDLPASAFTVRQNGEEVEATYFQELAPSDLDVGGQPVGGGDPATAGTEAPAATDGNYLVIYLDQLRLEQRDYLPTLKALRQLLEDPALVPEHVLMLRQDRGLFVESHLGSKRPQLLAALDRLGSANAAGLQAAAELDQALDTLREEWRLSQELSGTIGNGLSLQANAGGGTGAGDGGARAALGGTGSFGPDACDLFVQKVGATVDGWARSQAQRTTISLQYLSRTATFLAGLPGVKTVLYVSGGLETEPGSALGDYVSGLCPGGEALFALDGLGEELGTSFFQLTRHLNSNRVTLYPFKTGALRPSSSASASAPGTAGSVDSFRAQGTFEQRQRRQLESGLGVLADETGGRLMTTDDQLQALARRLATRYSLAYPPPETRGTEVRITVDVDAGAGA